MSSLSHGVTLKKEIEFESEFKVCVMKMSHDFCLHQESQAAQRQILMEFLKEARRNKREVSSTPPSLFYSTC